MFLVICILLIVFALSQGNQTTPDQKFISAGFKRAYSQELDRAGDEHLWYHEDHGDEAFTEAQVTLMVQSDRYKANKSPAYVSNSV